MARKKRWIETGRQDGIVEVKIYSWRYYMDYIYNEMLN